jgi:hypothetical protein
MTRVIKPEGKTLCEINFLGVIYRSEQPKSVIGVVNGIKRQSRLVLGIAASVGIPRLFLLEMSRVRQKDSEQVTARRSGKDITSKTEIDELG